MCDNRTGNFVVSLHNLKNGEHFFNFPIENTFFDRFENSFVEKGKGHCEVKLIKTETLMQIHFDLQVEVELVCDRSLENFDYKIEKQYVLLVKFGEHDEEINEELIILGKNSTTIALSKYIYEYILINVPMKKLHPKYSDSDEIQYFTSTVKNNDIDPRWETLKKLK